MSLQRSSQLLRPLCRSCAPSPLLLPYPTTSATTIIGDRSATRHYTVSASHQSKLIRKSPAARKVDRGYGKILTPTVPSAIWQKNYSEIKSRFEENYMQVYSNSQLVEVIDPKITPKVFFEIGRRLIDQAYSASATADALKNIWKGDPARVYEVAHAINVNAPWENQILAWAMKATREAGFVYTLALEVRHQLNTRGPIPPTSREIEMIKKIAYEKEDPIALSVWGEIAQKWGRTEEAIAIYKHLNTMAYPSSRRPRYHEDVQFFDLYKPPWKVLVELYNEVESFDEANEMLKVGALMYRDPEALVEYAYIRREKDDWEAYEQCLVAAAMSGHGEACFRLGNYYYRIFKGEISSRDQRTAEKNPWRARFSKLFGISFKKEDWRHIAVNWYEMASAHGYSAGTRNFAVLMREDGHPNAWELMNRLKSDSQWWNNKNIIKLRDQWNNPNFKPMLLASWLEL